jgi:serine/threonine protein kinase
MPRDPREFEVGDRVPGTKWVVRGKLGEGGMGLVLDVVKEPGILGAMKIMLPSFAKRPEFVTRFFDEVRLLAQLRHPHIVQVFDYDQLDDGTPYVVMERLIGVTLRAGLRNLRAKGTPISAKLTYEITRQLCEGLFRAHSNTPAIVHRDVKPENIFFHQPEFADTIVKVIDFGIAAVLDGTRDRRVFGTPRHMAPEQIRGEVVTPATDVYAAALVLYELLTGRFPWDIDLRNELALVQAHLHGSPAPASQYTRWVPTGVDEWIVRALSKDPRDRPRDAYEFIAKLYELQFVNDGTSDSVVDINTTAPTLACLAEAVQDVIGARTRVNDSSETYRGMTSPPIEGPSIEPAPPDLAAGMTDPMRTPNFSSQTRERAALASTQVPSGVDRLGPTRTAIPWTRPVPKNDTSVLSPSTFEPPATFEPKPQPAPVTAETPMASTSAPQSSIAPPLSARASRFGPSSAAFGLTVVAGLFVLLLSFTRQRPPSFPLSMAGEHNAASAQSVPAEHVLAQQKGETMRPTSSDGASNTRPVAPSPAVDAIARAQPGLKASGHPAPPPPCRAAHLATKAAANPVVPDDGRELLYVKP